MASDSGITSIDVPLQPPSLVGGDNTEVNALRKQSIGGQTTAAGGRNAGDGSVGQTAADGSSGQVYVVRNAECDSLCISEAGSWQWEQQDAVGAVVGQLGNGSGNNSPNNTESRKFGKVQKVISFIID